MIYFIRAVESGKIKIGESDNPVARIKQLKTGSPEKLEILGVISGGRYREKDLHKKFKQYQVRGEWFKSNPELTKFIREYIKDNGTGIQQCEVCGMFLTTKPNYEEIERHSDYHSKIKKGAIPHTAREFIKKVSWAVLFSSGDKMFIDASAFSTAEAKRTVVLAWWARAREKGLSDKAFEDYFLDFNEFLEAKLSGNEERYNRAIQIVNERWGDFD